MKVKGLGNNSDCKLKLDITLPTDFSVELTFSELSGYTIKLQSEGLATEGNGTGRRYYMVLGSGSGANTNENANFQVGDKIKFISQGSNVSVYVNGTLKRTISRNSTYAGFEIWSYSSRTSRVKDLIIDAL
jgi:hypothetical protein